MLSLRKALTGLLVLGAVAAAPPANKNGGPIDEHGVEGQVSKEIRCMGRLSRSREGIAPDSACTRQTQTRAVDAATSRVRS